MYVAITSDRGLAGGVHSSICKSIRNDLHEMTPEAVANTKIICVGDKSRAFMARYFPKNLIMVGSEIGRLPPQVQTGWFFYCSPTKSVGIELRFFFSLATLQLWPMQS